MTLASDDSVDLSDDLLLSESAPDGGLGQEVRDKAKRDAFSHHQSESRNSFRILLSGFAEQCSAETSNLCAALMHSYWCDVHNCAYL